MKLPRNVIPQEPKPPPPTQEVQVFYRRALAAVRVSPLAERPAAACSLSAPRARRGSARSRRTAANAQTCLTLWGPRNVIHDAASIIGANNKDYVSVC